MAPNMDLALLIQNFISVSLFSSDVMVALRYLNLWVNWTFLLFGRVRFGGRLPSVFSSFTLLRELGKNMASVLNLVLWQSTCICIPSFQMFWMRMGNRVFSSVWLLES